MSHDVKRSRNSNEFCSSDLATSTLIPSDLSHLSTGFKDKKTQNCVQGDNPEEHVIGIDWIREEILKYVIHDDNRQNISIKLLKTMRLVQKSWLSTMTKLVKKCGSPPLIQMTLESYNYFSMAKDIEQQRQVLEQFIATLGNSTRLKESFLPLKLTLGLGSFCHENYQSLSECFARLGNELVDLEITYPLDGGNMSVNFQSLSFPNLRKLSFQFSLHLQSIFEEHVQDNKFGLWFLQSILNAAGNLKALHFPYVPIDVVPATFEFLYLPPTIVSLELEIKLESKELETLFQRNRLPNLNHLTLQLHGTPLENGLMYKILEQFRKTLVSFRVDGVSSTGRPNPRSYLRFPQMEKLEQVNIVGTECELEQPTSLQDCLPKLQRVSLDYQTEAMLRKWVDNSKFEAVYDLFVSNVNEHVSAEDDNYFETPSPEIVTQLSAAFPNVRELLLHLDISSLNALECLFLNMNKVEKVELRFHGKFQQNSSDLVDSLITGIPISLVGALKENSVDILESVLVLPNGGQSSIRNLTELTTLSIATETTTGQVPLVSDLVFGQALMKMPKLRYLYFSGKFEPSPKMQKEWEELGRVMKLSQRLG